MSDAENLQPIIIVRRASDEDEGHHGGVWKIAFADFMTAMMAFFLVLWIVNSTSKETRSSVARYFNPIRLSESTPARKGLQSPKDSDFDASGGGPQAAAKSDKKSPDKTEAGVSNAEPPPPPPSEAKADPDHAKPAPPKPDHAKPDLAKLDLLKPEAPKPSEAKKGDSGKGEGKASGAGAAQPTPDRRLRPPVRSEEKIFDDPYAALDEIADAASDGSAAEQRRPTDDTRAPFRDPFATVKPDVVSRYRVAAADPATQIPPDATPAKAAAPPPAARPDAPKVEAARAAQQKIEAEKLAAEISESLRRQLGGGASPGIEVKPSEEGLLISLTDRLDFAMFAIGSSEPDARTIRAVEAIAKALAGRPGAVILKGHTDSRPFRSGTSDNWRLSSSRAQMAFHMLVRAGMDERRVERIEGRADRSLRNVAQPDAPENRRIEIVLRRENRT